MTEKQCTRCGSCCTVLPLFTKNLHPEYRRFLLYRGLKEDKEQGCILIPQVCQHLKKSISIPDRKIEGVPWSYRNESLCDVHDSSERPEVCKKFHGQKIMKGFRIYVPPECVYRED